MTAAHLAPTLVVMECRQVGVISWPSVNKPCDGQLHYKENGRPLETRHCPPLGSWLPGIGREDNLSRSFRVGGLQLSNA